MGTRGASWWPEDPKRHVVWQYALFGLIATVGAGATTKEG